MDLTKYLEAESLFKRACAMENWHDAMTSGQDAIQNCPITDHIPYLALRQREVEKRFADSQKTGLSRKWSRLWGFH